MPEYTFECKNCNTVQKETWSISSYDDYIKSIKCNNCLSKEIYRSYQEDNINTSIKDIKTIGQLADNNAKKMKSKINEENARNQQINNSSKPWYHSYSSVSNKDINKMTKKQKQNYILKGK